MYYIFISLSILPQYFNEQKKVSSIVQFEARDLVRSDFMPILRVALLRLMKNSNNIKNFTPTVEVPTWVAKAREWLTDVVQATLRLHSNFLTFYKVLGDINQLKVLGKVESIYKKYKILLLSLLHFINL